MTRNLAGQMYPGGPDPRKSYRPECPAGNVIPLVVAGATRGWPWPPDATAEASPYIPMSTETVAQLACRSFPDVRRFPIW